MRIIGSTRWREPASICAGNFFHTVCAHHLLNKIDIALQIPPITRNLPCRAVAGAPLARRRSTLPRLPRRNLAKAGTLTQPKPLENYVDRPWHDPASTHLIAYLPTRANR